jgi:hypothetical protein
MGSIASGVTIALEALLAVQTGYLLTLLCAAALGRRRPAARPGDPLRFAVLIPAHDEESGIAGTLASLDALDYPRDRHEAAVIADNCTDGTAAIARAAGATVYERRNLMLRGKGYALAWGIERLFADRPEVEAVAVLDADCRVSPNLLRAMDARLRAGARAVQVSDMVSNPEEGWAAALRWAGFALINAVRGRGKDTLRLSAGLNGTGMGFRRALLEAHPWNAFSVTEDAEYHAGLVMAGERVAFAPEAAVISAMPASLAGATTQHQRWEGGKWRLARALTPRLLRAGLRRRDPRALLTGIEFLLPPQSLLLTANVLIAALAAVSGSPAAMRLAGLMLGGQDAYVLGVLPLVRAPAPVWKALLMSPALVLWKLRLHAGMLTGRGPATWVRTARPAAGRAGK